MAIGATIHTFDVTLADVDRSVYEDFSLRVARHPSETDVYMVTRLIAYCLEYEEGIAFAAGGVSSTDEPAVLVRDLTGAVTHWIEIGAPDAARLHFGSKLAGKASVYTHRDVERLIETWKSGKQQIHRAEDIVVRSFDQGFIDEAAKLVDRRNTVSVSLTEGQLYLEINGTVVSGEIHEHRIA